MARKSKRYKAFKEKIVANNKKLINLDEDYKDYNYSDDKYMPQVFQKINTGVYDRGY